MPPLVDSWVQRVETARLFIARQRIKLLKFSPLPSERPHRHDIRNHRKIAVIDGQVAYTGFYIIEPSYNRKPEETLAIFLRIDGPRNPT